MPVIELDTERLLLRQWKDSDLPEFASLNSDPFVMNFFPEVLSRDASNAIAKKFRSLITERGWGFWATELKSNGNFIGFIGIHEHPTKFSFSPCTEIGWRLARPYWGKGYATEAATKVLEFSFVTLNLDEVVSFTAMQNTKSRAVMTRLGLTDTNQNFGHPDIPKTHPLSQHVLYKLTKAEWQESRS
ncbi:MAG: GNAT family N-acetyltransferase [Gammaproteobacteria bacterium]|jgi:RimJ/RimL family protein N-acetyltransferase